MYDHSLLVLRQARNVLVKTGIDALLVDQLDFASGTVADILGIPFVNLSFSPPLYLDDESPPFIFRWKPGIARLEKRRNKRGNILLRRLLTPIIDLVNDTRRAWRLPVIEDVNETFSRHAMITQMPKAFDFPRASAPPNLFHTGLFSHGEVPNLRFPWHRLDGRPLIYASMGTVRNGSRQVFETIAAASAAFNVQLVISLGGMALTPEDFLNLPGDPIVVHYGPQVSILGRATLTICHGGMNTTLESVYQGVPLIAIPVTDDQPGVAARIEWRGVGLALRFRNLRVDRLRQCIQAVLTDGKYPSAARAMQAQFRNVDGLSQAADIVERVLSLT